jgi:dTDP-4-dehydrorhamnose 3,5-epimerase
LQRLEGAGVTRLTVTPLLLDGLSLVQRQRLGDARGCFERIFCADELAAAGWVKSVAQVNRSFTERRGTVRGMHFQRPPHAEMKLVTCLRGEAWDVAVDVRAGSNTFLRWHAELLSADNGRALLIPEGFAHGFQTLTQDVEMLYFHSASYSSTAEDALHPSDPMLAIVWPHEIAALSRRDAEHALLDKDFQGVEL